ncbi:MAG: ATP-binding cassette domain-containing protein [Bacteroidales bacterium]|nr:ATP-binding cassette domain-containing protein [Bacteroidales bacterium]
MIDIKNFSFSYTKTQVFDNINLQFQKGAIYGLLGENGVGKTTLLKAISGLLKPTAGSCTVDEQVSFDRQPEFLQNIFLLPDEVQLPDSATPEKFFNDLAPFYPKQSGEMLQHLAGELKVDISRKFKEMSFGQQKKSLLACAMALNTDYLLLDEPTNGLDIPSKADFRRILSEKVGEEQTIIISTHQVKDVENLIDPIIIISNNSVLLDASVEKITDKLYFEYGGQQRPDALYSEMMPGGYLNVLVNNGMGESQLNIEGLFNAVLRNSAMIKNLFE